MLSLKKSARIQIRKKDLHEENKDYLHKVYEQFLQLAKTETNWHIVECVHNSSMRDIDDIASELLSIIERL